MKVNIGWHDETFYPDWKISRIPFGKFMPMRYDFQNTSPIIFFNKCFFFYFSKVFMRQLSENVLIAKLKQKWKSPKTEMTIITIIKYTEVFKCLQMQAAGWIPFCNLPLWFIVTSSKNLMWLSFHGLRVDKYNLMVALFGHFSSQYGNFVYIFSHCLMQYKNRIDFSRVEKSATVNTNNYNR